MLGREEAHGRCCTGRQENTLARRHRRTVWRNYVAEAFIGEIKMFSFGFAPRGWAFANGQLLAIAQNQALFALLGTIYGGNGTTTFALPNLQDRTPIHAGTSSFGSFPQGSVGGEASHSLTLPEMPAHSHGIAATTAAAPTPGIGPENALPAAGAHQPYRSSAAQPVSMKPGLVQTAGAGQAHSNLQPYLVINFCIALQGLFPSRN